MIALQRRQNCNAPSVPKSAYLHHERTHELSGVSEDLQNSRLKTSENMQSDITTYFKPATQPEGEPERIVQSPSKTRPFPAIDFTPLLLQSGSALRKPLILVSYNKQCSEEPCHPLVPTRLDFALVETPVPLLGFLDATRPGRV